jgi:hypothetical protein
MEEKDAAGRLWRAAPEGPHMAKIYRLVFTDDDREDADRQTLSLAGLALTLLILVVCVFLMKQLHQKSTIEDCLLAGHRNCDVMLQQR